MSSLFVYYPRLVVPLATFVMSLGWFRSVPARVVYLSCFRHICGDCLLLLIWLSRPGMVHFLHKNCLKFYKKSVGQYSKRIIGVKKFDKFLLFVTLFYFFLLIFTIYNLNK